MNPKTLRKMAYILGNADFDSLADAGILTRNKDGTPSVGGSDWERFNNDLITFLAKLPEYRLIKLSQYRESRL